MAYEVMSLIIKNKLETQRSLFGLTQKQMSEKLGISFRLYSKLEKGNANPTAYTIGQICQGPSVTCCHLLSFDSLRTKLAPDEFIKQMGIVFDNANYGVFIRDTESNLKYANNEALRIGGLKEYNNEKKDLKLLGLLESDASSILRDQLSLESKGIALPYSCPHSSQVTGEKYILRLTPMLIYPLKGRISYYSVLFLVKGDDVNPNAYYDFCKKMMSLT